jgi:uncharacterized protein (TIGR04255 family)
MPNQPVEILFEKSPLDEVVIGVQFEPLPKFRASHLGLFWSRVRDKYPLTDDHAPIVHQVELPEPALQSAKETVSLRAVPSLPRCWFLDKTRNALIQLQPDRFLRNWRQLQGTEPYPHFATLFREFKRELQNFLSFLHDEDLGSPSFNQCELTYINNIERGEGWSDFGDLADVFTVVRPKTASEFLPAPEMFAWEAKYKLPEGRGRLNVEVAPAFRSRDLKFFLRFSLTARGAPSGSSLDQIFAWFDLAHEWTVRAFAGLTDAKMHELWKRKT